MQLLSLCLRAFALTTCLLLTQSGGAPVRAQSSVAVSEVELPPPSFKPGARRTHPGVKVMRWGGLALAASGLFVASASYGAYVGGELTYERYEQLRLVNDIGWGIWGVGTLLHVSSWFIRPRGQPDQRRAELLQNVDLQLTVSSARLSVRY